MIRYGSVCSGIEAATTAWHPLGWQPVFFSEIEPFPCSVLSTHWPCVPNLGDLTKHESWNHEPIDLLVGGTPCQAFSVAGLREGLADPRGNLTLTFLALVKRTRPRWVVWENVPGVLSDRTNAFGHFLSGLAELGYGWAYRVLDAQYFGVAQRRRRVFVVACAGADWRRAAAVLFEPDCLRGNPPPSRQAGQGFTHDVAPCIGASGRGFERGGDTRGQDPVVACLSHCESRRPGPEAAPPQPQGARATVQGELSEPVQAFGGNNRTGPIDDAAALNAKGGSGRMDFDSETFIAHTTGALSADDGEQGYTTLQAARSGMLLPVAHSLRGEGFDASEDGTGRGTPLVATPAVAFDTAQITSKTNRTRAQPGLPASTMAKHSRLHVAHEMRVRRLTPRECERLQGFPDDHTLVPHRGKPAADGPRYKAIGNSMAVPVMAWIGMRIQALEKEHENAHGDKS